MEFSREGKHTVRCVISEQEILDLGYTMDEIISNGMRTQEFMNRIFNMAEREFETKLDMGLKTVRADILPDHTLSLTFSSHPGSENMLEHLRGVIGEKLENMSKAPEVGEEVAQVLRAIKDNLAERLREPDVPMPQEAPKQVIALFAFDELDVLMRYAKQVKEEVLPPNELYKFEDAYFLMMDMTEQEEEKVRRLSSLTDEYNADVFVGSEKRAYIREHGQRILADHAIEQLREI